MAEEVKVTDLVKTRETKAKLIQKNQELIKLVKKQDKELKELRKILNDIIPQMKNGTIGNPSEISPEEIIVDNQINRFKEAALSRPLDEREIRSLDILLKNKREIQVGKKPKDITFPEVSEAEMLALAMDSDDDTDSDE